MAIIHSDWLVDSIQPLSYPTHPKLWVSTVVGRFPSLDPAPTDLEPPFDTCLWKLPSLGDGFSRNIFALYTTFTGLFSIRLLSSVNAVRISPDGIAQGKTLIHQNSEFFPPFNWLWNMTITVDGILTFKVTSVSGGGHPYKVVNLKRLL